MLEEKITCLSMKIFLVILIKLELAFSSRNYSSVNQNNDLLCYTCVEPLIGYTDHTDSCKYLNVSSPSADAFVKSCSSTSSQLSEQYECRKLVISYRSVETFLRRDCVPKGLCSWKDKSQSMNDTPVSNCVYTDERTQKLECIYCCDTPLCNRTSSTPCQFLISLYTFFVFLRQLKSYVF